MNSLGSFHLGLLKLPSVDSAGSDLNPILVLECVYMTMTMNGRLQNTNKSKIKLSQKQIECGPAKSLFTETDKWCKT